MNICFGLIDCNAIKLKLLIDHRPKYKFLEAVLTAPISIL